MIETIIFDFGNIFIDLNKNATLEAFKKLGHDVHHFQINKRPFLIKLCSSSLYGILNVVPLIISKSLELLSVGLLYLAFKAKFANPTRQSKLANQKELF